MHLEKLNFSHLHLMTSTHTTKITSISVIQSYSSQKLLCWWALIQQNVTGWWEREKRLELAMIVWKHTVTKVLNTQHIIKVDAREVNSHSWEK